MSRRSTMELHLAPVPRQTERLNTSFIKHAANDSHVWLLLDNKDHLCSSNSHLTKCHQKLKLFTLQGKTRLVFKDY